MALAEPCFFVVTLHPVDGPVLSPTVSPMGAIPPTLTLPFEPPPLDAPDGLDLAAVERFVDRLAAIPSTDNLFNPWAATHPDLDVPNAAEIRRHNLVRYLASRFRARLLVVGEAAGYQGCRFSGIAFTSERQILSGLLGPGYAPSSLRPEGWSEPSATIVHKALGAHDADVVLFNILPLHPHRPAEPLTNRTPSAREVSPFVPLVAELASLLEVGQIAPVGRIAGTHLEGVATLPPLRHPAHGGATLFSRQITEILS